MLVPAPPPRAWLRGASSDQDMGALVGFGRPGPQLIEAALITMHRTAPWLVGWKQRGWGFLSLRQEEQLNGTTEHG